MKEFIFIMILMNVCFASSTWKQTKAEIDLTSKSMTGAEFTNMLGSFLEKNCKADKIAIYVLARPADAINPQLEPCDAITRIEVNTDQGKEVYHNPDMSMYFDFVEQFKSKNEVTLILLIERKGKKILTPAKLINGKLNLVMSDLTWSFLQNGILKNKSIQDFGDRCKKDLWQECFLGIPWGSSYNQVLNVMALLDKDLTAHNKTQDDGFNWFGTDYPTFKWEMGFEYEKDFYAHALFKKSEAIEEPNYSFVFIVTGENRLSMVSASERRFVIGDLDSSSCHKSFLEKHSKTKNRSCENKRCKADYGNMKVMTTCIPNEGKPGIPFRAGLLVYNTVYMNSPYFQNEYSQFKQRLQNSEERKKLLDSIKEKSKLEGVL